VLIFLNVFSKLDARYFEMTRDFQKLHKELVDEGFFKPSYSHIVLRFFECLLLILVGIYLVTCPHPVVKIFGAVIIGLGSTRCGWFMHEGGHYSLTGNPKMDRFLQSFSLGILYYTNGLVVSLIAHKNN